MSYIVEHIVELVHSLHTNRLFKLTRERSTNLTFFKWKYLPYLHTYVRIIIQLEIMLEPKSSIHVKDYPFLYYTKIQIACRRKSYAEQRCKRINSNKLIPCTSQCRHYYVFIADV